MSASGTDEDEAELCYPLGADLGLARAMIPSRHRTETPTLSKMSPRGRARLIHGLLPMLRIEPDQPTV